MGSPQEAITTTPDTVAPRQPGGDRTRAALTAAVLDLLLDGVVPR